MKKLWYVLFGILCVLFVSGCGAQQIDANPEKTTVEDMIPNAVQDVFQRFQEAAAGNNELVYISEPPQAAQFGGFEFPVFSDDTKRESLKVRFPRLDSDKRNLTIQVLILRETRADFTVRTLTTCLYALGTDELSVAREKANKMMDSLAKSDFSEVVDCGDYMVLLSNVDNKTNIEAVYKPTVWNEIDNKDYVAITNELYVSDVQGKEIKVFAEGTVTSWSFDSGPFVKMEVKTADGQLYGISYSYNFIPIKFELGQKVKAYGRIGQYPDGNRISTERVEISP